LFSDVRSLPGFTLRIDLPTQTVSSPKGWCATFDIDAFRKDCLLRNLDHIDLTLRHADAIKTYEASRRSLEPWIFSTEKRS
jgi:3-isopropylmalate/(R)-2-methylmalate dehydratase small subunit